MYLGEQSIPHSEGMVTELLKNGENGLWPTTRTTEPRDSKSALQSKQPFPSRGAGHPLVMTSPEVKAWQDVPHLTAN